MSREVVECARDQRYCPALSRTQMNLAPHSVLLAPLHHDGVLG